MSIRFLHLKRIQQQKAYPALVAINSFRVAKDIRSSLLINPQHGERRRLVNRARRRAHQTSKDRRNRNLPIQLWESLALPQPSSWLNRINLHTRKASLSKLKIFLKRVSLKDTNSNDMSTRATITIILVPTSNLLLNLLSIPTFKLTQVWVAIGHFINSSHLLTPQLLLQLKRYQMSASKDCWTPSDIRIMIGRRKSTINRSSISSNNIQGGS